MQPISYRAARYDKATIYFHWAIAILVVAQWLGAQTIDWFPRGPLRVDARSMHITLGVILAVILVGRIFWRLTFGRRLPAADKGMLNIVAKATHWGLYALLLTMVLVGIFLVWTRGDSIFNLVSIPAFQPGNKELADKVHDVHAIIGLLIIGLAGLHAAAALYHHYVWRDNVLSRMLPQK